MFMEVLGIFHANFSAILRPKGAFLMKRFFVLKKLVIPLLRNALFGNTVSKNMTWKYKVFFKMIQ